MALRYNLDIQFPQIFFEIIALRAFLQFQTQLYKNRETPQAVSQFIPQFSDREGLFSRDPTI
jgi:hypothetical protein